LILIENKGINTRIVPICSGGGKLRNGKPLHLGDITKEW
jgi:hypothetical protein